MRIQAEIQLRFGGRQSLDFLDSIKTGQAIVPSSPDEALKFPLSTFSFSCSLGVQPSTGTATASGLYIANRMMKTVNLENVEITVRGIGDEVPGDKTVKFKKLKIKSFTFEPLDAPEGPDRVYTLNFQDARWKLKYGGVYGYFNKTDKIEKGKIQFIIPTLKDDEEPWTYWDLIEKVAFGAGFNLKDPRELGTEVAITGGPKITQDSIALDRLDEYPMNKDYNGDTPASVIADLAKDIDFTLSIKPDGTLLLCPLSGTLKINPLTKKSRGLRSSGGAHYKPIPDKLYLVGGRVRDQIYIEPNLEKFDWIQGWYKAGYTEATSNALTRTVENIPNIEPKDFGLEPVCPDISGKIRYFYELLKTWLVKLKDISTCYQRDPQGASPWYNVLAQNYVGDVSAEEKAATDAQKIFDELQKQKADLEGADPPQSVPYSLVDAIRVAALDLEHKHQSLRAANAAVKEEQQRLAKEGLYPEEQKFLKDHPDFDVLEEKYQITQNYFFKLYRIPEIVTVNYDWSKIFEIMDDLRNAGIVSADLPGADEPVDRSYVLPMIDVVDEVPKEDEEESEEEAAAKKQADKGLSAADKIKKKAGLEFGKKSVKEKIRARFWGFAYNQIVDGVFGFHFKLFKEISSETVDLIPELGLVLFHRAPYALEQYAGFSEDCPFIYKACPIAAEFTYERKDPRLGVLNYFIRELERPGSIKGMPPDREPQLIAFEQIDEFVEHLLQGKSQDYDELSVIADVFAEEIWKKRVGSEASQARTVVPAPVSAFPFGPLQTITWQATSTTFEVNTDYQKYVGSTLTDKIKRALKEKGLWHRSETLDQKINERRGFFTERRNERFQDDERRILFNVPHKGAVVLYDPKMKEDVSFISAQIKDPITHTHLKWWMGPILCREPEGSSPPTYLATWIPLFGHLWWADSDKDLCPYNSIHSHAIGGFYQPHTYMPPGGYTEPIIVKNPVIDLEDRFPRIVRLGNEGATDSFQKAQKFEDESLELEPEQELWKANPRTVPRNKDGVSFQAGILLEYCIGVPVIGPLSAVFYHEWQLIQKNEGFDSGHSNPFRTGNGDYVLPIPLGEAWTQHRYCFCPIGPAGTLQDFDEYVALFKRSYGYDEDLHRGAVYITAVKWVWGWTETTPQVATMSPM